MVSLPGQSFPVWICNSGTGRSRFTYWAYAHDPTNRTTFLSQLSKQGMAARPTGSQPVSLKFLSHFQRGLKVLPAQQWAPYEGTWKPCTSPPLEFKLKTSAVQDPQSSEQLHREDSKLWPQNGKEQRVRRNTVSDGKAEALSERPSSLPLVPAGSPGRWPALPSLSLTVGSSCHHTLFQVHQFTQVPLLHSRFIFSREITQHN